MARLDISVPREPGVGRPGLLGLPRSAKDLWVLPRVWKVTKIAAAAIGVLSLSSLGPVAQPAVMLCISGWGWSRLARRLRRRSGDLGVDPAPDDPPGIALATLRDLVQEERGFDRDLVRAALCGGSHAYFGIGALVHLEVIGTNPMGFSPTPWLVATILSGIPAYAEMWVGIRKWVSLRRHSAWLSEWSVVREEA